MAKFEGFGPEAYRKKHEGKPVEDLVSKVVGNEGVEAQDPKTLETHKQLTRKQRERAQNTLEQG